jgi:hypothetical protein
MRDPLRLALPFLLAVLWAAAATASNAQGPPPVFSALADPGDGSGLLIRLDHGLLQGDPETVTVPLPGGTSTVAQRTWFRWRSADEWHWSGELDDTAPGLGVSLPGTLEIHYARGELFGYLHTAGGAVYRLTPDSGFHRLVAVESSGSGCGLMSGVSGEVGERISASRALSPSAPPPLLQSTTECSTSSTTVAIGVMVLYPRSLSSNAQEVAQYATARIGIANQVFNKSHVKIQYDEMYTGLITGEQPDTSGNPPTRSALEWLNDQFATPAIDTEVERLRKAYGADMIVLVIPPAPGDNCGYANTPVLTSAGEQLFILGGAFDDRPFVAVELNCGNGDLTFTHELGHTFGMLHENELVVAPGGALEPVYPWAYGYDIPVLDHATVMACYDNEGDCRRRKFFSHPDITIVTGQDPPAPAQVAIGQHSSNGERGAHNACVANLRRLRYAAIAQPPADQPPSLTITSPANGAQVNAGQAFNLSASATDPEDGDLRSEVAWESDRDGLLGIGSPLSATLSSGGEHILTATVEDAQGTAIPRSVHIRAFEPILPMVGLNSPNKDQEVSGDLTVTGWAIDSSGVKSLSFAVRTGSVVNPITLENFDADLPRPDVCSVYASLNDPNCPDVGFEGTLDASSLANGHHYLIVTATDLFDNERTFSRRFLKVTRLEIAVSQDTYVSEAEPSENFNDENVLRVRAKGSGQALHTYLKFRVSGVTGPLRSAKLQVRSRPTPLQGLRLYWMTYNGWREDSLTWANAHLGYYLTFPTSPHPANSLIEIDVSSIVTGNGTYTIGLVAPDAPNQALFGGDTPSRPKLELIF